jgi:hypothetical protein
MKLFMLLLIVAVFPSSALARKVGLEIHYACVGLDGIPITENSSLASQCCSGGRLVQNPPPACKAGFGSIISGAGGAVTTFVNQGIKELGQVADLTGATANYDNPQNVVPQAESQAMTADTGASTGRGKNASGVASGTGSGPGAPGAGGSGGSGGGAGGGMAGDGLGTPGSTKRFKDKAEDVAVLEAGRYKGAGDKDGKGGKDGGSPFDLFGRRDSGGSKSGGQAQGGLNFGGAQKGAGDGGNAAPRSEDDRDYLSRINPGDSIFKVVSKRYVKETVRNNVAGVEKLPAE